MLFGKTLMESTEFLVTVALLMVVLLGGAVVLHFANQWRKRREARATEDMETLTMYREMYENDEISEEEYQQIRERIAGRLKNLPEISSAKAVDSASPPPPPPEESRPIS
jgi:uncharacterized membrane protein